MTQNTYLMIFYIVSEDLRVEVEWGEGAFRRGHSKPPLSKKISYL